MNSDDKSKLNVSSASQTKKKNARRRLLQTATIYHHLTKKSKHEAFKWYCRAAEHRDFKAARNLAVIYEPGDTELKVEAKL